jgi:hypothetical protein
LNCRQVLVLTRPRFGGYGYGPFGVGPLTINLLQALPKTPLVISRISLHIYKELIQKIAEQHSNNMTRKDVKGVIESLAKIGYLELKKSGAFLVDRI